MKKGPPTAVLFEYRTELEEIKHEEEVLIWKEEQDSQMGQVLDQQEALSEDLTAAAVVATITMGPAGKARSLGGCPTDRAGGHQGKARSAVFREKSA